MEEKERRVTQYRKNRILLAVFRCLKTRGTRTRGRRERKREKERKEERENVRYFKRCFVKRPDTNSRRAATTRFDGVLIAGIITFEQSWHDAKKSQLHAIGSLRERAPSPFHFN